MPVWFLITSHCHWPREPEPLPLWYPLSHKSKLLSSGKPPYSFCICFNYCRIILYSVTSLRFSVPLFPLLFLRQSFLFMFFVRCWSFQFSFITVAPAVVYLSFMLSLRYCFVNIYYCFLLFCCASIVFASVARLSPVSLAAKSRFPAKCALPKDSAIGNYRNFL